jgi:predicted kinase
MRPQTLVICRGLPGSGKSTLAETLAPGFAFAADDYFTDEEGNYNFDPSKLGEAHNQCARNVKNAMLDGVGVVAVANTFTLRWEADPYFRMAKRYGYSVFVVHCQNDFGNVHGVPEAAIDRMRERWEVSLG